MALKFSQRFILLIILLKINKNSAISCEDFKNSEVTPEELKTINKNELPKCLAQIGINQLNIVQSQNIWNSVKYIFGGVECVPKECLKQMGWSLAGIPAEEYSNITIDTIDIVEKFGEYHGLNREQMMAVAERVREDFADKSPEDYSQYDLMALNNILCYFNRKEIDRIHADAFKAAISVIGHLKYCPHDILEGFARLAVSEKGFGDPSKWSKMDVSVIGVVMKGMPPSEYALIPVEFISQ